MVANFIFADLQWSVISLIPLNIKGLLYSCVVHEVLLFSSGLLEFLGNIGQARPQQTLEEHGAVALMVLQLAAGHLDLDGDPSLQASALRAVAHIGTSAEGKLALSKCSKCWLSPAWY